MSEHLPVLLKEAVDGLNILPNGIYVDATFGRGGHSKEILNRLGPSGHLVAIDRDPDAVKYAVHINDSRLQVHHAKFSSLPFILEKKNILKIDGLLVDLGMSSPQVNDRSRGFSFMKNGPLDMRMDPTTGVALSEWLKQAEPLEIQNILSSFGEERFSRSIAIAIGKQINKDSISGVDGLNTTNDLAELITKIYSSKGKRNQSSRHPATKSFQAFRIFINNEIEELMFLLKKIPDIVVKNGRVCIISFHSIEDRIVKKNMRPVTNSVTRSDRMTSKQYAFFSSIKPNPQTLLPKIRQIKRVLPSAEEAKKNKRSRSAVLRIGELVIGSENLNNPKMQKYK